MGFAQAHSWSRPGQIHPFTIKTPTTTIAALIQGCFIKEIMNQTNMTRACERMLPHGMTVSGLIDLLEGVRIELKDSLDGLGSCDHSVGVCVCNLIARIEDTDSAIMALQSHHDGQILKEKGITDGYTIRL